MNELVCLLGLGLGLGLGWGLVSCLVCWIVVLGSCAWPAYLYWGHFANSFSLRLQLIRNQQNEHKAKTENENTHTSSQRQEPSAFLHKSR